MYLKQTTFIVLFGLILSACGLNPVEKLQEAAAEKAIETIMEQASGAENIDINLDDENASFTITGEDGEEITFSAETDEDDESATFTVTGEDGEEFSMSSDVAEDITAIEGMGVSVGVPDGLVNGYVQRINEGEEVAMVTATFETGEMTAEQFFDRMHQELVAAGFTYLDSFETGKTQPDPTAENFLPFVTYEYADGINFTILWGDGTVILGLARAE